MMYTKLTMKKNQRLKNLLITNNNIYVTKISLIMLQCILIILATAVLCPFFYMVITSFKAPHEIFRHLDMPARIHWENYYAVFKGGKFFMALLNTLTIVSISLVFLIIISSVASYPLSRIKLSFFTFVYFVFLGGIIIPFQTSMVPIFKIIKGLGLMNTRIALILLNTASALPISIMIYVGFIKTVPVELEEAAIIDGCSNLRLFGEIIFPLLKPATITIIVINIFSMWNDFLGPLLFIHSGSKKPLITMIYSFQGERSSDWGPIFALCTLSTIPLIAIFLSFQKHFYKGIVAGAVKG